MNQLALCLLFLLDLSALLFLLHQPALCLLFLLDRFAQLALCLLFLLDRFAQLHRFHRYDLLYLYDL